MKRQLDSIFLIVCLGVGGIATAIFLMSQIYMVEYLLLLAAIFILTIYSSLLIIEAQSWIPAYLYLPQLTRQILGKPIGLLAHILYLVLYYLLLAGYLGCGAALLRGILFGEASTSNQLLCLLPWVILAIIFLGLIRYQRVALFWLLSSIIVLLCTILSVLGFEHAHKVPIVFNKIFIHVQVIPLLFILFPLGFVFVLLKRALQNTMKIRHMLLVGSSIVLVLAIICGGSARFLGIPRFWFTHSGIVPKSHAPSFILNFLQDLQYDWINILFFSLILMAVTATFLVLLYLLSVFFRRKRKGKLSFLLWSRIVAQAVAIPVLLALFFPQYTLFYLWSAGMLIILLFVILPAVIIWSGRYYHDLAFGYQVRGGRAALIAVIGLGVGAIYFAISMVG